LRFCGEVDACPGPSACGECAASHAPVEAVAQQWKLWPYVQKKKGRQNSIKVRNNNTNPFFNQHSESMRLPTNIEWIRFWDNTYLRGWWFQ
jgi:hypothetical protein